MDFTGCGSTLMISPPWPSASLPCPESRPFLLCPLPFPWDGLSPPPAFCTVTETIADITNQRLHRHRRFPRHRLDALADTPSGDTVTLPARLPQTTASEVPPARNPLLAHLSRPLASVDVFVDDFLAMAQAPATCRTRRTLLHTIDQVFRPLAPDDPAHRTEPISVTKLAKGDAAWSTQKMMLGWIIDSQAMTLTLPARRLARLRELLLSIPPTQSRLSLDKWHCLLGEL